jgi:hypothetical protein
LNEHGGGTPSPDATSRGSGGRRGLGWVSQKQRGFLNPGRVVVLSFWTTTICIVVAVVASILAIWEFTGTDALWRTVATCVVVGAGTVAFSWLNTLFGADGG